MKNILSITACSLLILLYGCGSKEENQYCRKHINYHEDHLFKVSNLTVRYEQPGRVTAYFSARSSIFEYDDLGNDQVVSMESVIATLRNADKVLTIEGGAACEIVSSKVEESSGNVTAQYEYDCGDLNNLKSIDIRLMQELPTIYEIEADIETPNVRKVFLINQKCDRAIYNYRK